MLCVICAYFAQFGSGYNVKTSSDAERCAAVRRARYEDGCVPQGYDQLFRALTRHLSGALTPYGTLEVIGPK